MSGQDVTGPPTGRTGRGATAGPVAPPSRWPARRWSVLVLGSLVIAAALGAVVTRAEAERAARRHAEEVGEVVANGLRAGAARLANRLAGLPTDCSAPAPMAVGGYLVGEAAGGLRCSVGLTDSEARVDALAGLRLPAGLPGRVALGVPSGDAVVVGLVPASELVGSRRSDASWAVLGPDGRGGAVAVLPATFVVPREEPTSSHRIGDATVVTYSPRTPWWPVLWPAVALLVPLVAALAMARHVVGPLERIARRERPGPAACREVGQVAHALERAEDHRRAAVLTLEQALDERRRRLAVELHDAPVQELAAANLLLSGMAGSDDWSRVGTVQASLRRAMSDLRRICTQLLPVPLSRLGFTRALLDRVEDLRETNPGFAIDVELDDPVRLDDLVAGPVAGLLLRNTLEAVRNALEHSGGSRIDVAVRLEPRDGGTVVDVEVADDGMGLAEVAATGAERDGHIGLVSMRSYVESVGGELELGRSATGGTLVRMVVPLPGDGA